MNVVCSPVLAMQGARRMALLGWLLVSVAGCATGPQANARDPLEPLNRGMFAFNDAADRAVFKPAAIVYRDVTPVLVRAGVTNFFSNLEDAWSFVNSLLQAKGQAAASNFMRVSVNTVMGLGGILDPASELRIERQREDFGQTLGWWGIPAGPYLVLPLLGPSTLRDTVAMSVDAKGDIVGNLSHVPTRNVFKVLDLLDTRTGLLPASAALDEVALDKYSFTRDAFLQRRNSSVFDGNPPEEGADAKPGTPPATR